MKFLCQKLTEIPKESDFKQLEDYVISIFRKEKQLVITTVTYKNVWHEC